MVKSHSTYRFVILLAVICVIMSVPFVSGAQPQTSVTITNNSSREIRHVYLAPAGTDDWGPDQLSGAIAGGGGSVTLSDVSCDGNGVKVIAEDQNGCFSYYTASCSSSTTWTITDSTAADCGTN